MLRLVSPVPRYSQAQTWAGLIAQAESFDDLNRLVRDFVAELEPQEIAKLPPRLVPPMGFESSEDLVMFAYEVARAHCGALAGDPVIFRLALFFTEASNRAAILMSMQHATAAANAGSESQPTS